MAKKKGSKAKQAPKDFVKEKRKVGKKRAAPQNETKTDFRVKRVQMPSQSALDEKGDEVTHRKHGLVELLAHMQHHSRKVRKDALLGLQELCGAHEGVLRSNLARIFEATNAAPIDDCAEVRGAFRRLQGWLLRAVPEDAAAAFAPTMALHVRSSLSHVSAEVRADGLALLELYLSDDRGSSFLGQEEVARVIETLCRLTSHTDAVLKCLHKLLEGPAGGRGAAAAAGGAAGGGRGPLQVPLHALLGGSHAAAGHGDASAPEPAESPAAAAQAPAAAESPVWGFCLRAWLQAGELPPSARGGAAAAARPGFTKLRCAAVMERALERDGILEGQGSGGGAGGAEGAAAPLRPSRSQLASLAGLVKRGEWPLAVESGGSFEVLAASVNLRLARVLALLAAGGPPPGAPAQQPALLARAALGALERLHGARLAASRAGALAGSAEAAGAQLLDGSAAVACAFRVLDLLWSCAPGGTSESGEPAAASGGGGAPRALCDGDVPRLVAATARLALGGPEAEASAPRVQSMPLVATLLGLRPSSAVPAPPPQLRGAWPQALAGARERSFAEDIELVEPGMAARWVGEWPKLLFYLGASDPALSGLITTLLLQLAKLAARPGSLHEQLFRAVCPLLVPFLAGAPGASGEPPPLARLPAGVQDSAPLLLRYFPRLGAPLISLLTRTVCRWSDLEDGEEEGSGRAAAPRLGAECCKALLEAVLYGGGPCGELPAALRLEAALAVLSAPPRTVGAERAAVRLADAIAEWLMTGALLEQEHSGAAGALGCDDRRRLMLQSVAWPICSKVLAAGPALGPRALAFFFLCALRLPAASAAGEAADLGWQRFLSGVFDALVLRSDGCLAQADGEAAATGAAALRHEAALCDATRFGRLPYCGAGPPAASGGAPAAGRQLARMLVAAWLLAVGPTQRPAAYELLVKRCAGCVVAATGASVEGAGEAPAAESAAAPAAAAAALVLAQAAVHRNELSLPTTGWPCGGLEELVDRGLASSSAADVRALLARCARGAAPLQAAPAGLQELSEVLPLL